MFLKPVAYLGWDLAGPWPRVPRGTWGAKRQEGRQITTCPVPGSSPTRQSPLPVTPPYWHPDQCSEGLPRDHTPVHLPAHAFPEHALDEVPQRSAHSKPRRLGGLLWSSFHLNLDGSTSSQAQKGLLHDKPPTHLALRGELLGGTSGSVRVGECALGIAPRQSIYLSTTLDAGKEGHVVGGST